MMNTSSFFSALSLYFATKHIVALHMPTVHSRAQTRDHQKAPAFCPFRWPLFPLHRTAHGYATHLPDLPWPRLVASRRSKHRAEANPAARLVQQGLGATEKEKFPVTSARLPAAADKCSRLRPSSPRLPCF